MKNLFLLGVCQTLVTESKEANLERAADLMIKASRLGCRVAVLPEMFNCPYETRLFPEYAEEVPAGRTCSRLREIARREKIYVVGGSLPEKAADGRLFNTSVVYNPSGRLIALHRKLHLFDVELDGLIFKESQTLSAGADITTFATEYGTMGLAICYDLRFPELSRIMALRGATVIFFPAAFNTTTGPAHWELLVRARAADNQIFVAAAAPAASPDGGYPAYGHSMVANPWGEVIAEAGAAEELMITSIDLSQITRVRKNMPLLQHRRTDLYGV